MARSTWRAAIDLDLIGEPRPSRSALVADLVARFGPVVYIERRAVGAYLYLFGSGPTSKAIWVFNLSSHLAAHFDAPA